MYLPEKCVCFFTTLLSRHESIKTLFSFQMTCVQAPACCALRNNSPYTQKDARNKILKSKNGSSIKKQEEIDISEKYFWIDSRNSKNLSYCSALQNENDSSVYE